ncbi:MAG: hypothetical protein HUU35_13035 [Armatimonadetes bacterium]|nr:hypothetical protein [Armatimonadota bacterium]
MTLLLLALLTTAAGAADFFRPAPDLAAGCDPKLVYPQGRIFPFGGFSLPADLVAQAKASGFTMLGPYYGALPAATKELDLAAQQGLPIAWRVGAPKEMVEAGQVEAAVAMVREQVQAVMARPEIAWWYLTPEELRHWRKSEIEFLAQASEAIRQTDPRRRPVWMYDPNHRDAAALQHTGRHLDLIGKGFYANISGHRSQRAWIGWSIEQQVAAAKAVRPTAAPLAVTEMYILPAGSDPARIPAWVRHDVYASLVGGAKGVMIWSLARRKGFDHHAPYLEAYQAVARELNGPAQLGQVFLFGEPRNDLRLTHLNGPEQVEVTLAGESKTTRPAVSWLDTAYGTDRYLFVVNSAEEPVRLRVEGLPAEAKSADAMSGDAVAPPGELELAPLEVRGWRFSAG